MNSFEKYLKKWYQKKKKKQLQTFKKIHEFSTILKNKNHLEVQFATKNTSETLYIYVYFLN
jgi:hypothetical protein